VGKYGATAVRAAQLLRGGCKSPEVAWETIAREVFSEAAESQKKACPKEAFFGLCESGFLRGVSVNIRPALGESPNRQYAVVAVRLLANQPDLAEGTKVALWRRVLEVLEADPNKRPNEQLDVVLALWNEGLIQHPDR
jgi:hypothetical protein